MARTTRRALAALATSAILAGGLATTASTADAAPRTGDRPSRVTHSTAKKTVRYDNQARHQRTTRSTSTQTSGTTTTQQTRWSTTTSTGTRYSATPSTSSTSTSSSTSRTTSAVNYASTTTVSTAGLSANAVKVIKAINGNYPQITSIGGLRSGAGAQDHGTGHAVDLMIPNYSSASGKALGDEIAAYLQQHASELGVKYVIWRQHIWSVQRSSEGWRAMADRGGVTANHYDHVHVSVN